MAELTCVMIIMIAFSSRHWTFACFFLFFLDLNSGCLMRLVIFQFRWWVLILLMMKVNQKGVQLSTCQHQLNGPMNSILRIPIMLITAMQTCILSTRSDHNSTSWQTNLTLPLWEIKNLKLKLMSNYGWSFQLRESKGMPTIRFRPHCGEVLL